MLCIRPNARAWLNPGECDIAVASSCSIDMVCMPVSKLRLERFPRTNVGTPRMND